MTIRSFKSFLTEAQESHDLTEHPLFKKHIGDEYSVKLLDAKEKGSHPSGLADPSRDRHFSGKDYDVKHFQPITPGGPHHVHVTAKSGTPLGIRVSAKHPAEAFHNAMHQVLERSVSNHPLMHTMAGNGFAHDTTTGTERANGTKHYRTNHHDIQVHKDNDGMHHVKISSTFHGKYSPNQTMTGEGHHEDSNKAFEAAVQDHSAKHRLASMSDNPIGSPRD